MPKANRTCYCCGKKYYYCPSCSGERKDPRIYTMWDSELCMEVFNLLTNESLKKITTLECKKRLIELGVNENTVLKDSVRRHVDRVMSYEEEVVENNIAEKNTDDLEEINKTEKRVYDEVTDKSVIIETKVESIKKHKRTKKSSFKNVENSEVD